MSDKEAKPGDNSGGDQKDMIQKFVDRMSELEDEAERVNADKKEVRNEIKANGLDPKAISEAVKAKRNGTDAAAEKYDTLLTYLRAVGVPV